ncbi:MAG TPA: class I SAM-dependent methyltransferase [Acidimicrobiales bacterium]|nr:class I SAM-dependent methyltransferase [Acidimicrobiales bacterium]
MSPVAERSTMDWEAAGRAWGARARDWAYLFEPYARPANELVFDRLGVGPGDRFLDIACGAGLAAQHASRRGATVSGLDAAPALVRVAGARTPSGDFRVGNMFCLPFDDGSFDVVTSFNGIWKGCEAALEEAWRVLVPGGRLGLTFWGRYEHLGLLGYFAKIIELSPPDHGETTLSQGDTGTPGVAEEMLDAAGFDVVDRGTVTVVNEWPDVEIALRALTAAGPCAPAIEAVGLDAVRAALREVIEPMQVPDVGIRIASEFAWITAARRAG